MVTGTALLQTLIDMSSNGIKGPQSEQGGLCQNLINALSGNEKSFLSTLNDLKNEGINLNGLVGLLKDNATLIEDDVSLENFLKPLMSASLEKTNENPGDDEASGVISHLDGQVSTSVESSGHKENNSFLKMIPENVIAESQVEPNLNGQVSMTVESSDHKENNSFLKMIPENVIAESQVKPDQVMKNNTPDVNNAGPNNLSEKGQVSENFIVNSEKTEKSEIMIDRNSVPKASLPQNMTADIQQDKAMDNNAVMGDDLKNQNKNTKPMNPFDDSDKDSTSMKTAQPQAFNSEKTEVNTDSSEKSMKQPHGMSHNKEDVQKQPVNKTDVYSMQESNKIEKSAMAGSLEKAAIPLSGFHSKTPDKLTVNDYSENKGKDSAADNQPSTSHVIESMKPLASRGIHKSNSMPEAGEKPFLNVSSLEEVKKELPRTENGRSQDNAEKIQKEHEKTFVDYAATGEKISKNTLVASSKEILTPVSNTGASVSISTQSESLMAENETHKYEASENVENLKSIKHESRVMAPPIASNDTGMTLLNEKPISLKSALHVQGMNLDKVVKIDAEGGGEESFLNSNQQSAERTLETMFHAKEPNAPQKPFQADVLSQVVEKAALNIKNGQTSININLRPESLGHLKMHISTENNQVMVRIITEHPMVKEIIESNLNQLRTELSNQGLEVEKFDVSVGQNSQQNHETSGNPSFWKMQKGLNGNPGNKNLVKDQSQQAARTPESLNENVIDYFA